MSGSGSWWGDAVWGDDVFGGDSDGGDLTLEKLVRTSLLDDATLVALVGQNIWLMQLPQNILDGSPFKALTYHRISTQRLYSHSSDAGVGWCRFQFTAWARSGASSGEDALDIGFALFEALKTFNAAVLPSSPIVHNAAPNFVINQYMGIEPNTRPPIYKCVLDVRICFQDQ